MEMGGGDASTPARPATGGSVFPEYLKLKYNEAKYESPSSSLQNTMAKLASQWRSHGGSEKENYVELHAASRTSLCTLEPPPRLVKK